MKKRQLKPRTAQADAAGKVRRRTDKAPDWLREFCRRESERTTPIPGGAASADYRQGALIGHNLRTMFAALEATPAPESPQTPEDSSAYLATFNKVRAWLREQFGTVTMLPTRDRAAHIFFEHLGRDRSLPHTEGRCGCV